MRASQGKSKEKKLPSPQASDYASSVGQSYVSEADADRLVLGNAVLVTQQGGGASLFFRGENTAAKLWASYTSNRPENFPEGRQQRKPITHVVGGEIFCELPVTQFFLDGRKGIFAIPPNRISPPVPASETLSEARRIFATLEGRELKPAHAAPLAAPPPPKKSAPITFATTKPVDLLSGIETKNEIWRYLVGLIGMQGVIVHSKKNKNKSASVFFGNSEFRDKVYRGLLLTGAKDHIAKENPCVDHPGMERKLYEIQISSALAAFIANSPDFPSDRVTKYDEADQDKIKTCLKAYREFDVAIRRPLREQGIVVLKGERSPSIFFCDRQVRDEVAEIIRCTNPVKLRKRDAETALRDYPDATGGGLYEIKIHNDYARRLAAHPKQPKERIIEYMPETDDAKIRVEVSGRFDELSAARKAAEEAATEAVRANAAKLVIEQGVLVRLTGGGACVYFTEEGLRDQARALLAVSSDLTETGHAPPGVLMGQRTVFELAVSSRFADQLTGKLPILRDAHYGRPVDPETRHKAASRAFGALKDFAKNKPDAGAPDSFLTRLNTIIRSGERAASNETAAGRG